LLAHALRPLSGYPPHFSKVAFTKNFSPTLPGSPSAARQPLLSPQNSPSFLHSLSPPPPQRLCVALSPSPLFFEKKSLAYFFSPSCLVPSEYLILYRQGRSSSTLGSSESRIFPFSDLRQLGGARCSASTRGYLTFICSGLHNFSSSLHGLRLESSPSFSTLLFSSWNPVPQNFRIPSYRLLSLHRSSNFSPLFFCRSLTHRMGVSAFFLGYWHGKVFLPQRFGPLWPDSGVS